MNATPVRSPALERIAGVGLFLVLSAWTVTTQQPARLFGDAKEYWLMSQQFATGQDRVSANGPFVFRPATPWLAATINPVVYQLVPRSLDAVVDEALGLDDVPAYYVLGIALSLATLWLLQDYLRCFIASTGIRLLLVAMWMSQWHAPVRWGFFNPVNVEPLFLACLTAALLLIERMRARPLWAAALVLTPVVWFGTLARESMVLLAVVFIVDRRRDLRRGPAAALVGLPLVASLLAVLFTRQIGLPTNGYSSWHELTTMAGSKPLFTWVLAWFFTFGPPAIALIVAARREVWPWLSSRPALVAHLSGCALLAYLGGTDTERILGWSAPVVLVLVGVAIEQGGHRWRRMPALVGVLILVHMASSRILWPIPGGDDVTVPLSGLGLSWQSVYPLLDKLLVIEHYYSNLWSYFGSRSLHAGILAFDLAFVGVVAAALRARAATPLPVRE